MKTKNCVEPKKIKNINVKYNNYSNNQPTKDILEINEKQRVKKVKPITKINRFTNKKDELITNYRSPEIIKYRIRYNNTKFVSSVNRSKDIIKSNITSISRNMVQSEKTNDLSSNISIMENPFKKENNKLVKPKQKQETKKIAANPIFPISSYDVQSCRQKYLYKNNNKEIREINVGNVIKRQLSCHNHNFHEIKSTSNIKEKKTETYIKYKNKNNEISIENKQRYNLSPIKNIDCSLRSQHSFKIESKNIEQRLSSLSKKKYLEDYGITLFGKQFKKDENAFKNLTVNIAFRYCFNNLKIPSNFYKSNLCKTKYFLSNNLSNKYNMIDSSDFYNDIF